MQTNHTPSENQQHATTDTASNQERKYFEIYPDMNLSSAPPLVWVNEREMKGDYRSDACLPFWGLPLADIPQITFDQRKKRGKLIDAWPVFGMWFVSDRLKQLLEQLDPQAFEFAATQVDYSKFEEPGPAYWLCNLVRQLDCIDDEKSKFTLYNEVDFKAYKALINIKMHAEVVGDAHAFRLVHKNSTWIVDDVFLQAMTAAKIRAWRFAPIQQA